MKQKYKEGLKNGSGRQSQGQSVPGQFAVKSWQRAGLRAFTIQCPSPSKLSLCFLWTRKKFRWLIIQNLRKMVSKPPCHIASSQHVHVPSTCKSGGQRFIEQLLCVRPGASKIWGNENKQDMAQLSRYSVHLGGDKEKHK